MNLKSISNMSRKQKRILTRIILTLISLILLEFIHINNNYIKLISYLIVYLIIGYDILKRAIKNITKGQIFDENFLMVVATIGSFALNDFKEGVFVMFFYQIGEFFQDLAIRKSRKNISELMNIKPDYANIYKDNKIIKVDPNTIKLGDIIVVKVGEKIPLDGIIVKGHTSLNASALTGESIPLDKDIDDEVLSGCINMESLIEVKVTKLFDESTASKILELVENATSNKSNSEKFITRFAKYYTPIVCYGALALAFIPPLFNLILNNNPNLSMWIERALTYLVISCPCALVISIPLSFFGGIGGASNVGILVKGSNYIEQLSKVNKIAFDKTGTITKGIFEVTTIHHSDITKEELIKIAAHAESLSSHPIAKSIVKEYNNNIDMSLISSIKEIAGKGIIAKYNNQEVIAGNEELMKDNNIKIIECDEGGTLVHIAINSKYKGHIHIGDMIKPTSKAAINELYNMNIKDIIMLTGDNKDVAINTSNELNIKTTYDSLLPIDKVNKIKELINENTILAFVGDGINDAPALKISNIGISMGALGSDAAIEAADVVLMDDDPLKVSKAIKIARKCMRIVKENIWFAIVVKVICLVLGALGHVSMWLAIFSDVGVMVIAVLNALRALNVKRL